MTAIIYRNGDETISFACARRPSPENIMVWWKGSIQKSMKLLSLTSIFCVNVFSPSGRIYPDGKYRVQNNLTFEYTVELMGPSIFYWGKQLLRKYVGFYHQFIHRKLCPSFIFWFHEVTSIKCDLDCRFCAFNSSVACIISFSAYL